MPKKYPKHTRKTPTIADGTVHGNNPSLVITMGIKLAAATVSAPDNRLRSRRRQESHSVRVTSGANTTPQAIHSGRSIRRATPNTPAATA